ncbi:MAG: OmpA family protein [Candidatus Methylomirabilia bacterium]
MRILRPLAVATLTATLLHAACAAPPPRAGAPPPPAEPKSAVVLLPDADGKVGRVIVSNQAGSRTLERAGDATRILDAGTSPTEPAAMSAAEIEAAFGAALSAQPAPPRHFILYFEQGSAELTPASRAELAAIVTTIGEYASVDTSVVGHSDTTGEAQMNAEISLRRAQAVGALLVAAGIDQGTLDITSHGEANPLVPTRDNVAEPRNRRVEVTVR